MTVTSHYIVPNDNGWWDNYEGQETIVFNDFRGGLPFSVKVYKCIDWENTLERTYSDWLESNVHFPGNRDILVMNKTIAMMNKSYFYILSI